MLRFPLIVLAAMLFSTPSPLRAQQPLSFQPGGREACAKAIGMDIPGPNENSRAFDYACAERDLALEGPRFNALDRRAEKLSPGQRVAFNALLVSFTAFRDSRVTGEICSFGQSCPLEQESEKAVMNLDFLELAEGRSNAMPRAADLTAADAALNDTYQKTLAQLSPTCEGRPELCPSQIQLRDTQRTWIRFRDAWLTFASLRWPAVPSSAWLTRLTQQRVQQLKNVARNVP